MDGGVGRGLEEERPPGRGGVEESGRGGVVGVTTSRSPSPPSSSPPSGVEGTPGKVKVDSSEHVQLAKGETGRQSGVGCPSFLHPYYESCSFSTIVEGTTKRIKILRETDSRAL